jgi:hypothetical protein
MLARATASQGATREQRAPKTWLWRPILVVTSRSFERALAGRWLTPRRFRHPPCTPTIGSRKTAASAYPVRAAAEDAAGTCRPGRESCIVPVMGSRRPAGWRRAAAVAGRAPPGCHWPARRFMTR